MRFRVLGPVEASGESGPINLGGPKQRLVLAHLLLEANRIVPAEALIDALWGEEPPEAARGTLQAYVSRLRGALGAERIEGRPPGYVFRAEPEEIDALRFEALLREARRQLPLDPKAATDLLSEAGLLWRGPALADLSLEPSLQGEITRLEEIRLAAVEDRIAGELELGRHPGLVGELETLTTANPLRERLWGLLMLALYRSGRQAEALGAYERARDRLAEELGIDPSKELQLLHERILRQDPALDVRGEPLRAYRLLERIGEGPFGVVYRAIQPQVGREVAIKQIRAEIADDPDFIRAFEAEAQTVARLEHPHIASLYDYWREPGAAYLVTRYLRGGSLAGRIATQGPLPLEEAARMLTQVAGALWAANRRDVVHGRIHAGNVLFDEDDNAYLSDPAIGGEAEPTGDLLALGRLVRDAVMGGGGIPRAIEEVLQIATAPDPAARFSDPLALARAFAKAAGLASAAVPRAIAPAVGPANPYKGLRPFTEADAPDFFGREALVDRLLARLAEDVPGSRFLAVLGPSGSGKSSVVRAGLVPALRGGALDGSSEWFVAEMFPGARPLDALEVALLRVAVNPPPSLIEQLRRDEHGLLRVADMILPDPGADLLVLVDQFEELFTLTDDERTRALFLSSLLAAAADPRSRVRVVATMRADFYDRPLRYQGFGDLLAERTQAITPLSPEELERAISGPAARVGVSVEPGLVADMATDVVDQPGGLPLVQYALTELFERRSDSLLTLDAYRSIGGISGALARRAEELYGAMNHAGRESARQLFLRLVNVGEDVEDARRLVLRSELEALEVDRRALDGIIETFGRHRLLSFDRDPSSRGPTVEVAHEALLREWGRLRGWIDSAREDLVTERRLAAAASEWESSGREESFLLRSGRLEQMASWADTTSVALSPLDQAYLEAGIRQHDEERAWEAARVERERAVERRSVRRLRALVAALTAGFLIAGTLTVIAVNQNSAAERALRLATARELGSEAVRALESDAQLATLLALESIDTSAEDGIVVSDAELVLRRTSRLLALQSLGGAWQTFRKDTETCGDDLAQLNRCLGPGVSLALDLSRAAIVGEDEPTGVWQLDAEQPGRRVFTVPTRTYASECPRLAHVGRESFQTCDAVFTAALSPDGTLLATGHGDRFVRVWDLASGRETLVVDTYAAHRLTMDDFREGIPTIYQITPEVGFSPDGRYLWTTAPFVGMRLWDVAARRPIFEAAPDLAGVLPGSALTDRYFPLNVALSEDGAWLALSGPKAQIWRLGADEPFAEEPTRSFDRPPPAFSPDGRLVAIPAGDSLRLVDLGGGDARELADFVATRATDFAFSPDGTRVAATTLDNIIRVWDVQTGAHDTLTPNPGRTTALAWSPDSSSLATGGVDGTVGVWDVGSGRMRVSIPIGPVGVVDLAFSSDGRRVAVATDDGSVTLHLVDLEDLIEVARRRLPRTFTADECRRYRISPCPA